MNRFPFLSYLTRKNEHCRPFFRNSSSSLSFFTSSMKEDIGAKTIKTGRKDKVESQSPQDLNKLQPDLDAEAIRLNIDPQDKFLHWKKKFKTRFQTERTSDNKQNPELGEARVDIGSSQKVHFDFASFTHAQDDAATSTACIVCDRVFASRRQLNEHKSWVHFPPYGTQKEFCYLPYFSEPKKFGRAKRQSCHLECGHCKKWFNGIATNVETYLERLKKKAKDNEEKKRRGRKSKSLMRRRVCELCSKILSNRKGLERHMLIHTGEKPYPCDICGKPFRRKDNCARHKKTAHLFKKPRKPRRRRSQIALVSGEKPSPTPKVTNC